MIFAFFIFATPTRALPPETGYRPKGSRHLGTFSGAFGEERNKNAEDEASYQSDRGFMALIIGESGRDGLTKLDRKDRKHRKGSSQVDK